MAYDKESDSRRLREAFYGAFDYVRQAQAAVKLEKGERVPGYAPVGGGMHFRCFAETAVRPGGAQLVVKVARPEFLSTLASVESWVRWLKAIAGLGLVPPMEVLQGQGPGEPLALVMPFGPDGPDQCAAHWRPLASSIDGFHADLRARGLQLGDVPQLRSWQGIPFIFDYSDLCPLAGGGR